MRNVYRTLCCIGALLCVASFSSAAEMTWTGEISDSMCGASHAHMATAYHLTAHNCTNECVKAGARYVFVSKGKVYDISNQNLADLQVHAGQTVQLTGTMNGDTITVSKVVMAPAKPS